jgi:glutamine cyclotransferase
MKKIFLSVITLLLLSACQKDIKIQINLPDKPQQNKNIRVSLNNLNHSDIDKILVSVDGQKLVELPYADQFNLKLGNNYKLGQHQLSFDFQKDGENIRSIQKNIELYAGIRPKVYAYELIHTFPHDINAFTQGLEFYKDTLYEGTGLHGESSLRKTDYKTGKIYKKIDLDKRYFGEGISVLNDKVYQLTWQSGIGFIYDISLNKKGEFKYNQSKEGWRLCNDGKVLYKSDGTEKIWQLDPDTLAEKDFINVYTDRHKIVRINELEWVNGKIYTNVWQKNALAIIDPKTGAVEGIVNLSDLHNKVTKHPDLDVLNGIAYDKKTGHLFVTGKKWDKMFEIKITNN